MYLCVYVCDINKKLYSDFHHFYTDEEERRKTRTIYDQRNRLIYVGKSRINARNNKTEMKSAERKPWEMNLNSAQKFLETHIRLGTSPSLV